MARNGSRDGNIIIILKQLPVELVTKSMMQAEEVEEKRQSEPSWSRQPMAFKFYHQAAWNEC